MALFELRENAGTQFDPRVVDAFETIFGRAEVADRHGSLSTFTSEPAIGLPRLSGVLCSVSPLRSLDIGP